LKLKLNTAIFFTFSEWPDRKIVWDVDTASLRSTRILFYAPHQSNVRKIFKYTKDLVTTSNCQLLNKANVFYQQMADMRFIFF